MQAGVQQALARAWRQAGVYGSKVQICMGKLGRERGTHMRQVGLDVMPWALGGFVLDSFTQVPWSGWLPVAVPALNQLPGAVAMLCAGTCTAGMGPQHLWPAQAAKSLEQS